MESGCRWLLVCLSDTERYAICQNSEQNRIGYDGFLLPAASQKARARKGKKMNSLSAKEGQVLPTCLRSREEQHNSKVKTVCILTAW